MLHQNNTKGWDYLYMMHIFENDKISITVNSLGAELFSLKDKEDCREYIWQGNPEIWARRSPNLFPQCGAFPEGYEYRGNRYVLPQHGFLRDLEAEVRGNSFIFSSSTRTREVYPFDFTVEVQYILNDYSLEQRYLITNESHSPLPYSLGFHTGLAGKWVSLDWEGRTIPLDSSCLAEVRTFFDLNCTRFVLTDAYGTKILLESKDYTTLVLWSAKGGAEKFVCLEPRIDTDAHREDGPFERTIPPKGKYEFCQRITLDYFSFTS